MFDHFTPKSLNELSVSLAHCGGDDSYSYIISRWFLKARLVDCFAIHGHIFLSRQASYHICGGGSND